MHMQYQVRPDEALTLPSFRTLYALTWTVGLLLLADFVCWLMGNEAWRAPFGWQLTLVAALVGGSRILLGAVRGLFDWDIGADLALAIALVAALVLKEYWVGAEVVLIAMIGESLEALTLQRTHRELGRILDLRPRTVRVRRAGVEREVPAAEVQLGELAIIRPGERVTVDGTVVAGRSALDQSSLTGESLPVDKGPGEAVYAGTLNQFGALEVRVEALGADTTLGQVVQLVAEARQHKAHSERLADTLARLFLPFVLALAAVTLVVTNWASVRDLSLNSWQAWNWMPTLAVLVVACPCALVLATPAAVLAALAWLARRGVLITGGAALERLAQVTHIGFDKTGTLTTGRIRVGQCLPLAELPAAEVLRLAASAEAASEHLIARAIGAAAREQGLALAAVSDFTSLPGAGIRASVRDEQGERIVLVGTARLLAEHDIILSSESAESLRALEASGESTLLVAVAGRLVGAIGVSDVTRAESASVLRELRGLGIGELVILTGDRPSVAAQVAGSVGIERWEAEMRPADKAAWLNGWRCESPGRVVAMVGDGLNDAPALAAADVGIALAGMGSDLAAEASDVVLLGDPLAPLPGLVRLSRETVRVIRQNIFLFAFFVNFLGIALTAWIMPTWSEAWLRRSPVAAALFHQIGSVLVLLNSMRLLWFERWHDSRLGRLEHWLGQRVQEAWHRLRPIQAAALYLVAARGPLLKFACYLLLGVYLGRVLVFVAPDEVAVVQRFGRFHAILPPGPHFRLPPPWDWITREQPARIRTLQIGLLRPPAQIAGATATPIEWNSPHNSGVLVRGGESAILLTGDQSLAEIGATIQYRVRDVRAFHFHVRAPATVLAALAESVLSEVVATRPLLVDEAEGAGDRQLLTRGRGDLENLMERELQARADQLGLGIEILAEGVCLEDVHPPQDVVDAFRSVSSAFKEQERMTNEGDAALRETVIKTAGLAAWQELGTQRTLDDALWQKLLPSLAGQAAVELAQAQADAVMRQEDATGQAARFTQTEQARAAAPAWTDGRLYHQSLGSILPQKRKLILDQQARGRRHLWLGWPAGDMLPAPLETLNHEDR